MRHYVCGSADTSRYRELERFGLVAAGLYLVILQWRWHCTPISMLEFRS